MQADSTEQYSLKTTSGFVDIDCAALEGYSQEERGHSEHEPTSFHGSFASCMEMYSDAATVARYLDEHQAWFPRCAQPMATELISQNGYALTIGRFGSFGYEVEPKIGLDLLPQDHGIYRIQTIPIPGYEPPGYDVDFQAALQLVEVAPDEAVRTLFQRARINQMPGCMTRVEWELDLKVIIQFPRFIHALPKSLVQNTGDQLLNKIVREVSRRLTHKVQEDFHTTTGAAFPKKQRKWL
jgi:Protein of unknown function (DUF1997)